MTLGTDAERVDNVEPKTSRRDQERGAGMVTSISRLLTNCTLRPGRRGLTVEPHLRGSIESGSENPDTRNRCRIRHW